ncbi:MAG: hypothetical protein AB7N76_15015 [Planctomycetota bacterium]
MDPELLWTGSLSGAGVLTALLVGVGAVLSGGFWLSLRQRRAAAHASEAEAARGRRLELAAFLLPVLVGGAAAYLQCWRGFYALGLEREALALHYWLPQRTVRVERGALRGVSSGTAGKLSRELRLETAEGTYFSAQISAQREDQLRVRLAAWRAQAAAPQGE